MSPRVRQALILLFTAGLAVMVGFDVAGENYGWIGLLAFIAVAATLTRALALPTDAIVLGMVMFGYIVGNRGFAAASPSPGLPLFPAEIALLIAGGWAFVAGAQEKRLPFRRDALNWSVLAWLVLGLARIGLDARAHGILAVRDFAMVYYAAFFFLAQRVASQPGVGRYLVACAIAACALLPPLSLLYEAYPEPFLAVRLHGTPLLAYKGDLALMLTAGASVLLFHWALPRGNWMVMLYALGAGALVFARESRASLLGSLLVIVLLLLNRRWAYPARLSFLLLTGAALILALATLTSNDWAEQRLASVSTHVSSIVNPLETANTISDPDAYKWDNNRFRFVWWRTTVEDTLRQSPLIGLGFGYDLAHEFLQAYNPDMADDFTARSPHNIAITALGRLGLVGLAAWVAVVACILREVWRSLRYGTEPLAWGVWCLLTIILVVAHLQVVLEGPMGAVPFWILLGTAQATLRPPAAATPQPPSQ